MRKVLVILISLLAACSRTERTFELEKDGMHIQAMQLKNEENIREYRVRILPKAEWVREGGAALQQAMNYRADSLFYLQKDQQIVFPDIVEPVANGVQGSFEYRLLFTAANPEEPAGLVYADRYITRQIYNLHESE